MDVRYGIVRDASIEEVIELYKAGGWWEESPEARAAIPALFTGTFAIMGARDASGRLIGWGRCLSDGVSDAYIQDVVVLNEFRGHGIGARIIELLVEHCQEKGITWVGLIAEPGVSQFYERLGFRPMENYQPMIFKGKPPHA